MKANLQGARPSRLRLRSLLLFGVVFVWVLGVSGLLGANGVTPGVWQAVQLWKLKAQRSAKLAALEAHLEELQEEKKALTSNADRIELEIRRQLGLVRGDEILVEFR